MSVRENTNNSHRLSNRSIHALYTAPRKPEKVLPFNPKYLCEPAFEFRNALRYTPKEHVFLWFRVRQAHSEELLWKLMSTGSIRKDHAYDPENLPFWTIGMRVKLRAHLSMGRVMEAIKIRLGTNCPGVRFCLDGFFGMRGFSDIFNNPGACPWMEVSNFSTVVSLRLQDGDNIFLSVATDAQLSDVTEWRRELILNNFAKADSTLHSMVDEFHKSKDDSDSQSDVIGQIYGQSYGPIDLM